MLVGSRDIFLLGFPDRDCPYTLAAAEDLDEMNIEILRNTLYKAYLDDFAAFCNKLGGATAEVMGDLLAFEVLSCPLYCLPVHASSISWSYPLAYHFFALIVWSA